MNAQCTHCNTIFRVDPAKIPAGGVRARCSICRNAFEIHAPPSALSAASSAASAAPAPAQPIAAPTPTPAAAPTPVPSAPAPVAAAPSPAPAQPAFTPSPLPTPMARDATAVAQPSPAAAPMAPDAPAVPAQPSPAGAPAARNPFAFGANDPGAKARRLARALVSDIVTYHPERRDQALQDGTLKREFMEEIKKSWEEYVGQVGTNVARSTPHFRDALNEILAKGQAVF